MSPHTPWCARGHRCGLGEHRADPIVIDTPGHGRATLTRVRSASATDHAEVRITIRLARTEPTARRQLAGLLHTLDALLTRTALTRRTT